MDRAQVAEICGVLLRDVIPSLPAGATLEVGVFGEGGEGVATPWAHSGSSLPLFFAEVWAKFGLPEGTGMGGATSLPPTSVAGIAAACSGESPDAFAATARFRGLSLIVRGWSDVRLIDAVRRAAPEVEARFAITRGGLRTADGTALVEIGRHGSDKGACLERLARVLGVAREHTVAFGDGANDITMLQWAATGVVVGNGDDAAKQAADVVLERTVHEDAVAVVLEDIVAGRKAARRAAGARL